jgi:hypothetical protein
MTAAIRNTQEQLSICTSLTNTMDDTTDHTEGWIESWYIERRFDVHQSVEHQNVCVIQFETEEDVLLVTPIYFLL